MYFLRLVLSLVTLNLTGFSCCLGFTEVSDIFENPSFMRGKLNRRLNPSCSMSSASALSLNTQVVSSCLRFFLELLDVDSFFSETSLRCSVKGERDRVESVFI